MSQKAQHWIEHLQLSAHPEGGAYREIFRAPLTLPQSVLTPSHNGPRSVLTSIYFLLQECEFSAFHRIASDELWHHYDGDTLHIFEITQRGTLHIHALGTAPGALPFAVINAGSWFGSRVAPAGRYTLCGCSVAPGFDFADFEMANRDTLTSQFPQHTDIIKQLTHQQ